MTKSVPPPDAAYVVTVQSGLMIWRCTEAIDPRQGTFRTIGNAEGRCVEIVTGQNQMLFDRRLARQVALAILEIAGPAEELASDLAQADVVEMIYQAPGSAVVVGFKPHLPTPRTPAGELQDWLERVRAALPDRRAEAAEDPQDEARSA